MPKDFAEIVFKRDPVLKNTIKSSRNIGVLNVFINIEKYGISNFAGFKIIPLQSEK